MDVFIDLEKCREFMTIIIDGKENIIKLTGTMKQPYFCGKDVCDILGHKNYKYALRTYVPLKYKKTLSYFYGENNQDLENETFNTQFMIKDNHYLGKKEITFTECQIIYISEPGIYSLIMNSKTTFANMFQELVYETILPSIREYGLFQVENELSLTMAKLAIKDNEVEMLGQQLEQLLKEKEGLQHLSLVEDTNKSSLEKIRIFYQRIGEEEVELITILEQETIDAIKMLWFPPN